MGAGLLLLGTCIITDRVRSPSHHPVGHGAFALADVLVARDFDANGPGWRVSRGGIDAAAAVGIRWFGERFTVPIFYQPLHHLILVAPVKTVVSEKHTQWR